MPKRGRARERVLVSWVKLRLFFVTTDCRPFDHFLKSVLWPRIFIRSKVPIICNGHLCDWNRRSWKFSLEMSSATTPRILGNETHLFPSWWRLRSSWGDCRLGLWSLSIPHWNKTMESQFCRVSSMLSWVASWISSLNQFCRMWSVCSPVGTAAGSSQGLPGIRRKFRTNPESRIPFQDLLNCYLGSCSASSMLSCVVILQSKWNCSLTFSGMSRLMSTSHCRRMRGLDRMFCRCT